MGFAVSRLNTVLKKSVLLCRALNVTLLCAVWSAQGLFVWVLRHFQQFFSYITTVSGCDRELNAHFYNAALLKHHDPDT